MRVHWRTEQGLGNCLFTAFCLLQCLDGPIELDLDNGGDLTVPSESSHQISLFHDVS
jgi:hypothetical protein